MALESKKALITGITGQDGSYLADYLLTKDYHVVGLVRRNSQSSLGHAAHLRDRVTFIQGDVTDTPSLVDAISTYKPDEIYNLAAQSHVGTSFAQPFTTQEITGSGALKVFEATKLARREKKIRIYQASSSEMFGRPEEIPQTELTPLRPANPYAASKVFAHNQAKIYRDIYGMAISCGILFNHESPRRGSNFVTQKIAYGAACAALGIKTSPALNEMGEPIVQNGILRLGNLDAERDWGYAPDFVRAMWLMLQHECADDFVVATGARHSIRDFCDAAYSAVDLNYQDFIGISTGLKRPSETGPLQGDPAKARNVLGWEATTSFDELVSKMVTAHLATLK